MSVLDPIDDGPITEGPPKTIPELFARLVARADDDKREQSARDKQRDDELTKWRLDELAWKDRHDREANSRHLSLFSVYEKDRQQNAEEHKAILVRVSSIETTGITHTASQAAIRASKVIAACAICVAVVSGAGLGLRAYAIIYSPVIHMAKP